MKTVDWDNYDQIIKDAKALAFKKSNDYGVESLTAFGSQGCLIRLYDKSNRLKNLMEKKEQLVVDEKIEDTCLDIINYSIYLIMMEKKILEKNEEP